MTRRTAVAALTTVATLFPAELGARTASPRRPAELVRVELETAGQWRQGFVLVDIDSDGDLDLVHGPPRAGNSQPRLFVNDGKAAMTPLEGLRFEGPPLDYGDVAAADFDGDGTTDLAFGIHLRGLRVLSGDGQGGFRPSAGGPDETGDAAFPTLAIGTVDWDRDGRTDLVALSEGPRPGQPTAYGLRVLLNRDTGWRRIDGEDPGRLFGDGLALGDFDGDGQPDAVAASRSLSHRAQVFLGRGASGWVAATPPLRSAAYVFAVTVCDPDRDGRDEILVGFLQRDGQAWRSSIDLLDLADGAGWTRHTLSERAAGQAGERAARALACGDLDGDGRLDLVAGSATGELTWHEGKGELRFGRPKKLADGPEGGECGARHLALADLDGRPGDELVASHSSAGKACRSGGSLGLWRSRPAKTP